MKVNSQGIFVKYRTSLDDKKSRKSAAMLPKRSRVVYHTTNLSHVCEDTTKEPQSKNNYSIYKRGFGKKRSNILTDIYSFSMIYQIHQRDKSFKILIPDTLVINSGIEQPMVIKSGESLEFIKITEGSSAVKQKLFEILSSRGNKNMPKGLLKAIGGRKRLILTAQESLDLPLDLSQDVVFQQFLMPKGLRVSKHRVILSEAGPKVYIIVNNLRIDSKLDNSPSEDSDSDDFTTKTSVMNHAKIVNYIKNYYKDDLPDIEKLPPEKKHLFEIFKHDPTLPQKKQRAKKLTFSDADQFLTHNSTQQSQFYEGKNSGYSEIIEITEYLKRKINTYILKDQALSEIAVDFFKSIDDQWYFLKVAHGITKPIMKEIINIKAPGKPNIKNPSEVFNDNYVYEDERFTLLQRLLHPANRTESQIAKAFAYHKKFYGFD